MYFLPKLKTKEISPRVCIIKILNIHRLKNTKFRFGKKSNADLQEFWLISAHYIKVCIYNLVFYMNLHF